MRGKCIERGADVSVSNKMFALCQNASECDQIVLENIRYFMMSNYIVLGKASADFQRDIIISHSHKLQSRAPTAYLSISVFEIIGKSHYQGKKRTQRLRCAIL